jgi:hypothetical protein
VGPLAGEKENYYSKIHLTTVQLTTEKPAAVTVGCMVAGRQGCIGGGGRRRQVTLARGRATERARERVCLFLVSRAASWGGASGERSLAAATRRDFVFCSSQRLFWEE